jgi:hypothetical protein
MAGNKPQLFNTLFSDDRWRNDNNVAAVFNIVEGESGDPQHGFIESPLLY